MNIEEIRDYCLGKPGVTEGFPFGEDTLVFKVAGKIFVLLNLESELTLNLKCDPELALSLREHYDAVMPGYHMNKKYWNTVIVSHVSAEELKEWIDHSWEEVVAKLPVKDRERLGG
jgi:predicted DNA-binding protein (MmcQ/YjbR family)